MANTMAVLRVSCVFLGVYGIGYGVLGWLVQRVTRDRPLRRLLLMAYTVRVLLAVALFAISSWHWPIFRSLQLPNGFWKFGSDAPVYDQIARSTLDMWAQGIVPWSLDVGIDYFLIVAAIYKGLGRCLLYPVLLNCWFAALSGLLAYLIGRRLVTQRAAFRAAVLVSFWPSSFLWSAQLMAEPLTWLLVFAVLALILSAVSEGRTASRPSGWLRLGWRYIALGGVVIFLTGLRSYLSATLLMTALIVLGPASAYALLRKRFGRAFGLAGIIVVVAASISCARSLDLYKLFSPHQPEQGDYVRGIQDWKQGELERAEASFREAIRVHQRHQEAYMALGALKVQTGKLEEALKAYFQYLPLIHPEDVRTRTRVNQLIANIYQVKGDRSLAASQQEEAIAAYALAVRFDPTLTFIPQEDVRSLLGQLWDTNRALLPDQERVRLAEEYVAILQTQAAQAAQAASMPALLDTSSAGTPTAPPALSKRGQKKAKARVEKSAQKHAQSAAVEPPVRPSTPSPHATATPALVSERSEKAVVAMALAQVPSMWPQAPPKVVSAHETSPSQAPTAAMGTPRPALRRSFVFDRLEPIAQVVWNMRMGFLSGGGGSVMDPHRDLSSAWELIAYLPRALAIGFLAPFPSQWFETGASVGGMRVFAGVEMLLVYLLLPSLLWGLWRMGQRLCLEHVFFLTFIVSTAVAMSLVVANVGTLFRLRLLFLLPLLIVVAEGDPRGLCRRVMQGWKRVGAVGGHEKITEGGTARNQEPTLAMRGK